MPKHGVYEKKSDAFNGSNTMDFKRSKKQADTRMRAQKIAARIKKEGIA